ncbi:nucleoside hydrolase [Streptomyces monomycini]|uniref:nucleoside hydrolase n=1 Tax=Streptomyces monomycini TaxID=371720 RepID=UPI0004ABB0C6|nr:nucleoside hydrolase [Streptomyces monomycini]
MTQSIPARLPVVIDTDPGVDDCWALLYLATQPTVDLVAVGAIHGNVPTDLAAENALRILDVAGRADVPVAVGAPGPLQQALATGQFVHGQDGLGGHAGPPSARRPIAESAAEQLVRLARQRPGELTLLALAPLTNIALALRLEPRLPELLRQVVFMGGAVQGPGNLTAWADANVGHDPEAAEEVMRAGFTMTMVPMDTTASAWVDGEWLDEIAATGTPAARYATQVLDNYLVMHARVNGGRRGCVMHDPLTAAIMLDPTLATYEERQVVVELVGHARGATLVDARVGFPPEMSSITDGRRPIRIAVAASAVTAMERVRQALTAPAAA